MFFNKPKETQEELTIRRDMILEQIRLVEGMKISATKKILYETKLFTWLNQVTMKMTPSSTKKVG